MTTAPAPPRLTALPHPNIAKGLRGLAALFDLGDMPAAAYPDQAPRVDWIVPSAGDVRDLAARLGVEEVEEHVDIKGNLHTSFDYGIGTGAAPGRVDVVYTAALVLHVVYVPAPRARRGQKSDEVPR